MYYSITVSKPSVITFRSMPKAVHFKSFSGYKKWLAYKNIHNLNRGTNETIFIHGKRHHVNH